MEGEPRPNLGREGVKGEGEGGRKRKKLTHFQSEEEAAGGGKRMVSTKTMKVKKGIYLKKCCLC